MVTGIITDHGVFEIKKTESRCPCSICDLSDVCGFEAECQGLFGDEAYLKRSPELSYLLDADKSNILEGDSSIESKDVVAGWFVRKMIKEYKKHDAKRNGTIKHLIESRDHWKRKYSTSKEKSL